MGDASWYNTGYESKVDPPVQQGRRFWMPMNTTKTITIVDDVSAIFEMDGEKVKLALPFLFHEHNLRLNGHWRNWFTCLAPLGKICPLDKAKGKLAPQVAAYTVIDHDEWTDKDGKKHKDELKLYVVKTSITAFSYLEKKAKQLGSLRGVTFEVSRLGDNATKCPTVGTNFEKVEPRYPNGLPNDFQPFNYLEQFKPRSAVELKSIIGAVADEAEETLDF